MGNTKAHWRPQKKYSWCIPVQNEIKPIIWGAVITPEPYSVDLFSRIPTLESRGSYSLATIRIWTHKRDCISRANGRAVGCLLERILGKLTALYRHRTVYDLLVHTYPKYWLTASAAIRSPPSMPCELVYSSHLWVGYIEFESETKIHA